MQSSILQLQMVFIDVLHKRSLACNTVLYSTAPNLLSLQSIARMCYDCLSAVILENMLFMISIN